MKSQAFCNSFCVVLIISLLCLTATSPAADPTLAERAKQREEHFQETVRPLLAMYCLDCHAGDEPEAGFSLEQFDSFQKVTRQRKVFVTVLEKLKLGEMPPEEGSQPTPQERARLVAWAETASSVLDCDVPRDPGRVTIRRLNRSEYNNTIRDLVGIDFQPADDFPSDDVGYGFDNIGDVLSLSPILLEKYLDAAQQVVERAIVVPDGQPVDEAELPESHRRIFICRPTGDDQEDCARRIIADFARRAFRRPVEDDELERLLRIFAQVDEAGEPFERSIQVALTAVLVSPHFLFRVEAERQDVDEPAYPISDFELATRLSYFLWSSMPDDELFALAERGKLGRPEVVEQQVRRMLDDPKSQALVENFAGQWLTLRTLDAATPDPELFPDFDEPLRDAMRRETELFFEAVLREDRSVLEFLDADYTFLNERLARHYGIDGVAGEQFRKVQLPADRQRGGVLTQASILTLTSNPTRTSPVKRGKWIMEQILGTPPPPPPPNVPELEEDEAARLSGSLRERMEQHRANPVCASCHQRMDTLGFGFENFDAVGAWRDLDGRFEIDPSGTLPDGSSFDNPPELKAILLEDRESFARSLTEKMLTYALGRGLEFYDDCTVADIAKALAADDYRFSRLVVEIALSPPFRMRRSGDGEM